MTGTSATAILPDFVMEILRPPGKGCSAATSSDANIMSSSASTGKMILNGTEKQGQQDIGKAVSHSLQN